MEKIINIELRLKKRGSVFTWEVFLENTNSNSRLGSGWYYNAKTGYYHIKLDHFPIYDEALDVFIGCEGKENGEIECSVFIDNTEQPDKVICRNTDYNYGHQAYRV